MVQVLCKYGLRITDRPSEKAHLICVELSLASKAARSGLKGFCNCLCCAMQAPAVPYQQSSVNVFWDEREGEMLLWLRRFLSVGLRLSGSTEYQKRIKDLQPSVFFDCICLVSACILLLQHTD